MSVLSDTTVNLSNYKTKLNLLNGFSKQFTSQMETMEIHERSIPNSNHRNCRSQQHKISHAKSNVKDRRNNIMVGTDHLPQHRRRTYYKSVTSSGTSNPPVTKQTSPITDHRSPSRCGSRQPRYTEISALRHAGANNREFPWNCKATEWSTGRNRDVQSARKTWFNFCR